MRPTLLLLSIVTLSTIISYGQISPSDFKINSIINKFQLSVGPSIVGVRGSSEYDKFGKSKYGFVIGLNGIKSFGKSWDIDLRLFYERKGFKQSATTFIPPDYYNNPPTTELPPEKTEITGNLNNDYLTLYLIPRYLFGNRQQINIGSGLYMSHLVKSKITVTDTQNGLVKRRTVLNQDETYKNYDYGITFTLGYTFAISEKIAWSTSINYNLGLMNVVEMQPGLTAMKNNSASILFSVILL